MNNDYAPVPGSHPTRYKCSRCSYSSVVVRNIRFHVATRHGRRRIGVRRRGAFEHFLNEVDYGGFDLSFLDWVTTFRPRLVDRIRQAFQEYRALRCQLTLSLTMIRLPIVGGARYNDEEEEEEEETEELYLRDPRE